MARRPDKKRAATVKPEVHRNTVPPPPAALSWLREHAVELGIGLFLAAATLAVFGRTVGDGFVEYDDNDYVYENQHVLNGLTPAGMRWAFTHIHAVNWHPLTTLSHMLDCQLYGLWAGGHHLTNVFLHAAASVALFLALRRLTGAVWRSGLVAAFFCLHPLHAESVAWISERKDVLSGLFFMLTLWVYAGYARRPFSWARYMQVLVLFGLGLLCKPMLVTLPFVLLLLDYWPLGRGKGLGMREALLEKLPLLALSAASCVVTYMVQWASGVVSERVSWGMRLQTAVTAYADYLVKMVWPFDLAVRYPRARAPDVLAAVACGLALAVITAALVLLARRGRRYLAVGWFWYLGMLVPVIGLVTIGDQSMADRYTYLPLIGVFVAVVWGGAELLSVGNAGVGLAAAAVLLILCAFRTFDQLQYWSDGKTLLGHALAVMEKEPMPDAIAVLQRELAADPGNLETRKCMAFAWLKTGRPRRAMGEFEEMLRQDPKELVALNSLAWLMATDPDASVRNGPEALKLVQRAVAEPNKANDPTLLDTLAASYAETGQFQQAVETAEKARAEAERAGKKDLAGEVEARLKMYRSGKPFREAKP